MSYYQATVFDGAVDQRGCSVWADKHNQQATYQLRDGNGVPLPHHPMIYGAQPAQMPMAGPVNWCPMQPAPMQMACPTSWCPTQRMAPFAGMGWYCPQPVGGTVAVVGKPVEEDKWTKHCDGESGEWFYYNERTKESTWKKPEGFEEKKTGDKPPPPPEPKKEKKKGKYDSDRTGWL